MPSLHYYALYTFAVLGKPCQGNFGKFQESGKNRFGGSEKDRYFLKILKYQHKLFRDYKLGKLVSYFLNNAVKTCLYKLKTSKNIEIEHVFQSKAFFISVALSTQIASVLLTILVLLSLIPHKNFQNSEPLCFAGISP